MGRPMGTTGYDRPLSGLKDRHTLLRALNQPLSGRWCGVGWVLATAVFIGWAQLSTAQAWATRPNRSIRRGPLPTANWRAHIHRGEESLEIHSLRRSCSPAAYGDHPGEAMVLHSRPQSALGPRCSGDPCHIPVVCFNPA